MGIVTYADETIIEKLKCLASNETFCTGLVIGQINNNYVYVTHLAPLPSTVESSVHETSAENAKGKPTSLLSLKESMFAIHAHQVVRMLPGGLDVVGMFIISPPSEQTTTAVQGKLRMILSTIHKATSKYYLGTMESSLQKIILTSCPQSMSVGVKTFDLSEHGTTPVTSKLKVEGTKWLQMNFSYSLCCPFYFPKEKISQSLSKSVLGAFEPWAHSLSQDLMLIDGKLSVNQDDPVLPDENESPKKKGGKSSSTDSLIQVVDVQILENLNPPKAENVSKLEEYHGSVIFKGTVAGRAFINSKGTFAESYEAVRKDLIRTMASRWEMHCDSLIEEPPGSSGDPVLHEPPRRVFIPGGSSPISLCDYLFPGDDVCDACESAREILGFPIPEDEVDCTVEEWADPEEFRTPETLSAFTHEEEVSSSLKRTIVHYFPIIMALFIALSSTFMAYLFSTKR